MIPIELQEVEHGHGTVVGSEERDDDPTSKQFYRLRFGPMFMSRHQRTPVRLEREKANLRRGQWVCASITVALALF